MDLAECRAAWFFHVNTCRHRFNVLEPAGVASEAPFLESPRAPFTALPPQGECPVTSLQWVIESRISCRGFSPEPIALGTLAAVLRSAYGITGRVHLGDLEHLERPVPSGGGLYPLEIFVLARRLEDVSGGVHHFAPLYDALETVRAGELDRESLGDLFLDQPYAAAAPVILVLCAALGRTLEKYGDRGYRYVLFEAGHVAQNVNLVATALGLGSLNLGGFFDRRLAALLEVSWPRIVPLYGIALGVPLAEERIQRRHPALPP